MNIKLLLYLVDGFLSRVCLRLLIGLVLEPHCGVGAKEHWFAVDVMDVDFLFHLKIVHRQIYIYGWMGYIEYISPHISVPNGIAGQIENVWMWEIDSAR